MFDDDDDDIMGRIFNSLTGMYITPKSSGLYAAYRIQEIYSTYMYMYSVHGKSVFKLACVCTCTNVAVQLQVYWCVYVCGE